MKYLKIVPVSMLVLASACTATKNHVITDSGEVYEVRGGQFYKQGEVVTELISSEEKENIITTLDNRTTSDAEILAELEVLEATRLDAVNQSKALQAKLDERYAARTGYIKAKNNLDTSQNKYQRLHDKGELSPNDEAKWAEKLDELSEKVLVAEDFLNSI